MSRHLNIKVFGKVQGVYFRATTGKKAREFDIKGFATNEPDGSVYIEAEGEKEQLDKFIGWCQKGPERAVVEKVESQEDAMQNFKNFETRH